ncbi:MAG: hypothetical protein RR365_11525 [Bacteroides sp.]
MYIFNSTREVINTLNQAKELLEEMFEKRKSLSFRYEYALGLVEENRLQMLLEREVIRRNGAHLELDERFREFFELLLEANEEISTASIDENIQLLHQHIDYYLKEDNLSRKNNYLRSVKSLLKKIGKVTIRNVIGLQRKIESTFKTEPNYRIKIAKLENLDNKRADIKRLIDAIEELLLHKERLFFQLATDEELSNIVLELRQEVLDSGHSLIRSQQDIINYLNQIKNQVLLVEKIRKVKYLRDQFELQSRSNLKELLAANQSVILEGRTTPLFKLSLDFLARDEGREVILKANRNNRSRKKLKRTGAGAIDWTDLEEKTSDETFINLEEVKNSFLASGHQLFNFVMNYSFQREVNLDERVTVFCQLVSLYEAEFDIQQEFGQYQQIEYAIVYPKQP